MGSTVLPEEAETEPTLLKLRGSDEKLHLRSVVTGTISHGKATDVAVSGDAVYVVTADDASVQYFLTKARTDGSSVWERRVGSDRSVCGLSADDQGSAYLAGSLFGSTPDDAYDLFARKYTPSGGVRSIEFSRTRPRARKRSASAWRARANSTSSGRPTARSTARAAAAERLSWRG